MHAVFYITASGQHQHRQVFSTCPQTREHLETIQARQPYVQDHRGVFLAAQGQVRRHAVMQHINGQTHALERLGDTFGELQMVFNQQDTHGFLPHSGVVGATLCPAVYSRNLACEARKH